MITYSGIHIQKIGGEAGTPTPKDIAVHSGRICRFGGCVWYPLLPHLVFVGLMAYQRKENGASMLWGFLHDAHEIATSDVPRPFKCDCMRKEQDAIDGRLYTEYFEGGIDPITLDTALVKQCDHDACDIEAIELGVPGFANLKMKFHDAPEDVQLFRRIMDSPFASPDVNRGEDSLGVRQFAHALQIAKDRQYGKFVNTVLGWNLL